jgi:hypothetical protein
MRAERKVIDKIVDGLNFHRQPFRRASISRYSTHRRHAVRRPGLAHRAQGA